MASGASRRGGAEHFANALFRSSIEARTRSFGSHSPPLAGTTRRELRHARDGSPARAARRRARRSAALARRRRRGEGRTAPDFCGREPAARSTCQSIASAPAHLGRSAEPSGESAASGGAAPLRRDVCHPLALKGRGLLSLQRRPHLAVALGRPDRRVVDAGGFVEGAGDVEGQAMLVDREGARTSDPSRPAVAAKHSFKRARRGRPRVRPRRRASSRSRASWRSASRTFAGVGQRIAAAWHQRARREIAAISSRVSGQSRRCASPQ